MYRLIRSVGSHLTRSSVDSLIRTHFRLTREVENAKEFPLRHLERRGMILQNPFDEPADLQGQTESLGNLFGSFR